VVPAAVAEDASATSTATGPIFAPLPTYHTQLDPGVAEQQTPYQLDETLSSLAELAPDARLLVSAAVVALAGAAVLGARVGGSGGDMRMAFTNVRLLPCMVRANLEHHVSMLSAAVAGSGGSGSGVFSAAGGDAVDEAARSTRAVRGTVNSFARSFRNGFDDAVGRIGDETEDGLSDSRLMMQIGMLLGFVYLGFLTVWFWATRGRSQPARRRP
jgi:hypothetical protein